MPEIPAPLCENEIVCKGFLEVIFRGLYIFNYRYQKLRFVDGKYPNIPKNDELYPKIP